MERLFPSPMVSCPYFYYTSWEEKGVFRERMDVFGKPTLGPGDGFREVLKNNQLITLFDKETHIWNYLEFEKQSSFGSAMAWVFYFLVSCMVVILAACIGAYLLGEYNVIDVVWYIRYPAAVSISLGLLFAGLYIYDIVGRRKKEMNLLTFLKELSKSSGNSMSYYRTVLEKIVQSNDKRRAQFTGEFLTKYRKHLS